MALQVAGVEKINSMDFCRAPVYRMDFCRASVYRARFFRITKYQMLGWKTNGMNDSQVFFEITVRAGSPRSQGILNKRAASSPGLLNISHRGTKPRRCDKVGC
jgi:hypothetical protein